MTSRVRSISLAALREQQLEMDFGAPPPAKPEAPGPDTAQYLRQLEQGVARRLRSGLRSEGWAMLWPSCTSEGCL